MPELTPIQLVRKAKRVAVDVSGRTDSFHVQISKKEALFLLGQYAKSEDGSSQTQFDVQMVSPDDALIVIKARLEETGHCLCGHGESCGVCSPDPRLKDIRDMQGSKAVVIITKTA